jgi:hypothetical protein
MDPAEQVLAFTAVFRDRSCVLNEMSIMAILAPVYVENGIQRRANVTSLSDDRSAAPLGSIKGGEILHQLSERQLIKKGSDRANGVAVALYICILKVLDSNTG